MHHRINNCRKLIFNFSAIIGTIAIRSNGTANIADIINLFHKAFISFSFFSLSISTLLSSSKALYPAFSIAFFISEVLTYEGSKLIFNFSVAKFTFASTTP